MPDEPEDPYMRFLLAHPPQDEYEGSLSARQYWSYYHMSPEDLVDDDDD